jgi:hypothetical protein
MSARSRHTPWWGSPRTLTSFPGRSRSPRCVVGVDFACAPDQAILELHRHWREGNESIIAWTRHSRGVYGRGSQAGERLFVEIGPESLPPDDDLNVVLAHREEVYPMSADRFPEDIPWWMRLLAWFFDALDALKQGWRDWVAR